MTEPLNPGIPPPSRQVDKLQLTISDKFIISAEGRLAIVVAAAIVIAVVFLWTR